jgi:hypothetical protein
MNPITAVVAAAIAGAASAWTVVAIIALARHAF